MTISHPIHKFIDLLKFLLTNVFINHIINVLIYRWYNHKELQVMCITIGELRNTSFSDWFQSFMFLSK